MKQKKLTLLLACCMAGSLACGCAAGTEVADSIQSTPAAASQGEPVQQEPAKTAAPAFGYVLETAEGIYYWKYSSDSFEPTGMWTSYAAVEGTENAFVHRDNDGNEQILFTKAGGYGPAALVGDRVYYQTATSDPNVPNCFTCKLDGSDESALGQGKLEAMTEDGSYLVCANSTLDPAISVIDTAANQSMTLNAGSYLACQDDTIYYAVPAEDTVTISAVQADGTGQKALYTADALTGYLAEGGTGMSDVQVEQFSIVKDKIYFTYGRTGGTGGFWQGGNLVQMNLDGTQAVNLGEPPVGTFVVQKDGSVKMHTEEDSIENAIYMDQYFWQNGIICTYSPDTGEVHELLTPADCAVVGSGTIAVQALEPHGDMLYALMTSSTEDDSASMGWRQGYRRECGVLLQKNLSTGNVVSLFTY